MKRLILFVTFFCLVLTVNAQVWQWSGPVFNLDFKNVRVWLWVPPECKRLKGVVIAQHNMQEISILENESFRKEMARLGLAEIWVSEPFDYLFRFPLKMDGIINRSLTTLGRQSGYYELEYVPIITLGHSAAGSWPYYYAAMNPLRTLAAISISGQWPYMRDSVIALDNWGRRTINKVPALQVIGEYAGADTASAEGLKERWMYPLTPLSMLACPAEGHFEASQEKIDFIALYIRKVMQYRVPARYGGRMAANLRPIDPTKKGWLVDRWHINEAPRWPAAPVGKYTGDHSQAFWVFDEEMARAIEDYQSRYRNQKAPLIGYVQQDKVLPQYNFHQQVNLQFLPEKDGMSFSLSGTFLDTVPGGSRRPAEWTGLPAGTAIGKPKGIVPVSIDVLSGPVERTAPNKFRLHFRAGMMFSDHPHDVWFAATHPGDDEYKAAVQQARMSIPAWNLEGKPQQITFDPFEIVSRNKRFLPLKATSDAGLPVQYFVAEGPAYIRNDTLFFTKVPRRARYPVPVTVCAWQYGIKGEIQSAPPVFKMIQINKKR